MKTMSSELFETREDDFIISLASIKKLQTSASRCIGEERKKMVGDARRKLEDASSILQEMEREIRKAPAPYRSKMQMRLRGYKKDLDTIANDLDSAGNRTNSRTNAGFAGEDPFDNMEASHRARLFQGNEILSRTTDSIARSQQISAETDMIGHEIIGELGTQHEQLERTRDRLTETDSALRDSRKILKGMAKRIMTNKLILIVILILEAIVLIGIIYWKFFS